jgi:hypothetical protein
MAPDDEREQQASGNDEPPTPPPSQYDPLIEGYLKKSADSTDIQQRG